MKLNLLDLLSGNINVPMPHINVVSMMKEENMNIMDFVHLPTWAPFAGIALAIVVVVILLGSIKSLVGWPGLVAIALVLALVGGDVDGARRALDWTHTHYRVKGHVTDLGAVFW